MVQWTKLAFLKYKDVKLLNKVILSICSFYLHLSEGLAVQILTQGKLSAPRILRTRKVINYVVEKMVLDKPLDNMDIDGSFAPGLPLHVTRYGAVLSLLPTIALSRVARVHALM
ncbi:hypothetical protein LOK49_LG14G01847 [Camellia lanceoleosa]|uniref:Uncharacterized protein n=1 Tax=Camellia lanceoleosa TaxID=1840588 RepID=A0ACC0FC08_9ERIC|nr:hypothetical protein LOK49_LG14G01847 [Camellia lanceoleosa]